MKKTDINYELENAVLNNDNASIDEIKALLEKGASPVAILDSVVFYQPCEVVKLLLDNCNYDVNCKSDEQLNPSLIELASQNKDLKVFSMLINDYGADCPNEGEDNPIQFRIDSFLSDNHELSMEDFYLYLKESCHIDDQHIFWNAIRSHYLDLCKYMNKEKGVSLDEKDREGFSAIHIASMSDSRIDILKWLVEDLNVSLETEDSNGVRPIRIAYDNGFQALDIVTYLLKDCGVDLVDVKNGYQHLFWNAIAHNRLELCKYLYEEKNISRYKKNEEGFSAIHIASMSGSRIDILKWLVEDLNVSPETRDSDGFRPIHIACDNVIGAEDIIAYLIRDCGVFTTVETDEHLCPIHYLVRRLCLRQLDWPDVLKHIIEKYNFDVNVENSVIGIKALDFTKYYGCREMSKYLVKLSGDNGKDKRETDKYKYLKSKRYVEKNYNIYY